ncbi:MAG: hypothetical protein ACK5PP_14375, partial [Acidimicrobiales bacterium]
GRPFDVDGVEMCYGYAAGDGDAETTDGGASSGPAPAAGAGSGSGPGSAGRRPTRRRSGAPPPADPSEPLPVFQGGPEDELPPEF